MREMVAALAGRTQTLLHLAPMTMQAVKIARDAPCSLMDKISALSAIQVHTVLSFSPDRAALIVRVLGAGEMQERRIPQLLRLPLQLVLPHRIPHRLLHRHGAWTLVESHALRFLLT